MRFIAGRTCGVVKAVIASCRRGCSSHSILKLIVFLNTIARSQLTDRLQSSRSYIHRLPSFSTLISSFTSLWAVMVSIMDVAVTALRHWLISVDDKTI